MTTTVIRNAAWVVAWDAGAGRHAYRCDVDLAFTDDRIIFSAPVSPAWPIGSSTGRAVRDARPRSTSIRTRSTSRSIAACARSTGCRAMHMTGLYERWPGVLGAR